MTRISDAMTRISGPASAAAGHRFAANTRRPMPARNARSGTNGRPGAGALRAVDLTACHGLFAAPYSRPTRRARGTARVPGRRDAAIGRPPRRPGPAPMTRMTRISARRDGSSPGSAVVFDFSSARKVPNDSLGRQGRWGALTRAPRPAPPGAPGLARASRSPVGLPYLF